ncbi:amino acid adenylation domain-containing protein [Gordonia sp. (in: high G+C Gram-positive bacteria)]|uniref:amino acid adenylation domain-containing protein n=1 Tax=Gordonia sp. (in: high G+C Gram-positive bacteria) TaxID=84139 RepID=UPI0039E2F7F2
MRPTQWVLLDELPLNDAGKVARRELPQPELGEREYVAPDSENEAAVAAVFADVLGVERVSVEDSFFGIGGNSLAATRVAARTAEALGVMVTVREVFEAPTVRELVRSVEGNTPALPPVVAVVPRPGQVPLSFAQQRMWFINRLDPVSPVYNVPTVLRVRGGLDVEALHAALVDVVVRHEVLRTVFPDRDGVPAQSVAQTSSVAARLDWAVVGSRAEVEAAVMAGFDLVSEWPIRVRVWEVASDEHVLAVITHHIASDGESQLPLVTDLLTAYSARVEDRVPEFAPLPLQFADFAIWQHEVLGSPEDPSSVVGRQLGYWTEQLAGLPDVLSLPADRPRPSSASHEGHQVDFEIPRDIAERVEAVAERFGVTPFMVVHAVLSVLLSRLSATDDVAVATPIAGRGQAELDRLIGMFVNTLVLRARVDSSMSFVDLLGQVRKTDLDAFAHADVPFEAVVDAVDPVRSEAFAPLAQVLLSFDPGASARDVDVAVAGLEFSAVESEQVPAQLDLYITVSTTADQVWSGSIVYATDLFDASTVELFAARLVAVLDGVTVDPSVAVGDVDLLAPEDVAAESAWEWGSERSLPGFVSVGDVLAAQVARTPDARALVFGERVVSYGEFGARVNGFARELIAAGVGPDVAVAVAVPRSVEMMVAVHAVVAAGGQYVPVDLGTPADRVKYMFETAQVKLMLVSDRGVAVEALSAAEAVGVPVLGVDASGEIDVAAAGCAPISVGERRGRLTGDSAVYTLFTSGSTGMPKGVTLSHGAVLNRLWWGLDELPIDGSDVVVQKTPFTFDCSVPELFAPLMVGAALVVLRQGGHLEPVYVASEIVRTGATMVHFVPSMLSVFLDVVPRELLASLTSVRIVSATGEALPPAVAAPAREVWPDALFYNLYGPTEAAVEITYQSIGEVRAEDSTVPIGVPVWNSSAVVLDSRLQRVPVGVPGELYLGGVQLARGYAGRPDLTAERFVADPHSVSGARLYRTGDLVRRLSGGVLEYLGRTDFQIKLRGQRIELGEIEAVLAAAPGVVHTAVTVASSPDGGEHSVGYVCAGPGESLDVEAVKVSVAGALPGYMVPTVWMVVDDIALNTAGKIDRKALPVPEFGSLEAEYVAPESEVEEKLAAVFADVLGVDRVSVTESFFDAGGNSLSAMRLVARAGEALGVELNVRDLFDAPTVRELVVASVGKSEALPPVVAVVPRPERVPLSFAQQRMWFINQFEPEAPTYNIPAVLRLTGTLDVDALRVAVADVVRRHEVLRTTFPDVEGEPVQVVAPESAVESGLPWFEVASVEELERAASAGFDVSWQWPLRAIIHRLGDGEFLFAVVAHHIAADGESMLPLITDMLTSYAARMVGQEPQFVPLPVQIADYAIWQHEVLGSVSDPESVVGRQVGYWREQLAGVPDVLDLPMDRPRPAVASHIGAQVSFVIPAVAGDRIATLARDTGTTPFMVIHAALAVLLARLSGTEDIAIATPTAGRGQAELDALVGMFVNTLVLRARVDSSMSFADLLEQVRETDLGAFGHAEVPFESVVEALDPVRSQAFAPLAQVMLSFDPGASAAQDQVEVTGLTADLVDPPIISAQVDLTFSVSSRSESADWLGSVVYATELFDESAVQILASRFVALLDVLTADPGLAVGDAPMLTAVERGAALVAGTGPVAEVPAGSVADAVAARVVEAPEKIALLFEGREVSYGEFGARVAVLARELIAVGVGPEAAVGVCIERGVELLVAVHAVTAAGGQYVPVDTGASADRAGSMLATAGVRLVLVAAGSAPEAVAGLAGVELVEVDASGEVDLSVSPVTDVERSAPLRSGNALYTLFTSGSTGTPKGVTVSHASVVNRLVWMRDDYGIGVDDRFLLKTPYTFDVSVWELYLPFLVGAPLVVARPDGHRDPAYLAETIGEESVSVVHFVPSMLSVFLDVLGDRVGGLMSLRLMFTSGEALPAGTARELLGRLPGLGLHNLYGPTEAAVDVTAARIGADVKSVTIGRPVANTTAFVLDDRLRPVPVGVPGELYLGGVQVARGYAARVDLTAERFVADPYGGSGARLYRTGDLVKRLVGGDIEYLGRTDFQVKLRGQRIELGEVESVIAGVPGVVHAAASVAASSAGAEFLVGYVSPTSVDLDAVKAHAAGVLPEYMRPSVWMLLDEVVLNTAGKLDRRALPEPDLSSTTTEYVAPVGEAEEAIAAVFADVLGVERVGVNTSFFDLGGNSLSAMRLVARAGESLGVELSIRDLFDAPTVRALAVASVGKAVSLPPVTRVVPRPGRVPLSFAQQRMWFINRLDPVAPTYNIPAVMRLSGAVDLDFLRAAVVDVVCRHEVLRTTFPDSEGVPVQVIAPESSVEAGLPWIAVGSLEGFTSAVAAGFDVTSQWPIRVVVYPEGDGFLFAVVGHHIGADGESMLPLMTDVLTAYAARVVGEVPRFVPLPVQFADFAIWQHEVLGSPDDPSSVSGRQLAYWREALAGIPDVLELPADRPRPAVASYVGTGVDFTIPAEVAARVTEFSQVSGATPFMVVHAALSVLLARLSATEDIAVVTPVAGRGKTELDSLVGMFVNTLVLRARVDTSMSFADLVDQVRVSDLDALAHQDVPFESVVEALDPVRSESFAPLAQVMLSFDPAASASQASAEIAGISVEPLAPPVTPAQVDLTFNVNTAQAGQDWSGSLIATVDLFDESTAQWFADVFVRVLSELTSAPSTAVGDAPIVDPAERGAALVAATGPAESTPAGSVADAVAAQVVKAPEAVALSFEGREVSYGEFGSRVAVLARELIAAGVGPDVAVGVCIDRGVELLVAIHAVTAAGGQYVPVDTGAPADRAEYMFSTAGVRLALVAAGTKPEPIEGLVGVGFIDLVEVDASGPVPEGVKPIADSERVAPLRGENALYTLFTSGSTGTPKGVTVSHGSVLNRLWWGLDAFGWSAGDRIVLKTPYTFDVSVPELYAPLMSGATVVIARPDGHREPGYIADLIAESQATSVHFVPSMLSVFLDVVDREKLASLTSLKWLFASGEALPPATVKTAHEIWPWIGIHNLFGPTEAAVEVGWADVSAAPEVVTIGKPVWNTTMLVLDDRLAPVPDGVPGELYLGGVQVARGYAARPDLTAERFVPDPYGAPGARLYRTGDLVRRLVGGDIEYLGRTDFQVKLRGQRIELGEIEAVLAAAPGVVHAAAAVVTSPAGGQVLAGFVSPSNVDLGAVKVHIAESLPEYMRPTVWTLLDEVALNTAGKLDRRALPEPDLSSTVAEYVAAAGEVEEKLAAVFADVLGVDRVSVTESFFDMGGNSLSAMRSGGASR